MALAIVSPTRSMLMVDEDPGVAPPGGKTWTKPGPAVSVTVVFNATAETSDGIPNRSVVCTDSWLPAASRSRSYDSERLPPSASATTTTRRPASMLVAVACTSSTPMGPSTPASGTRMCSPGWASCRRGRMVRFRSRETRLSLTSAARPASSSCLTAAMAPQSPANPPPTMTICFIGRAVPPLRGWLLTG